MKIKQKQFIYIFLMLGCSILILVLSNIKRNVENQILSSDGSFIKEQKGHFALRNAIRDEIELICAEQYIRNENLIVETSVSWDKYEKLNEYLACVRDTVWLAILERNPEYEEYLAEKKAEDYLVLSAIAIDRETDEILLYNTLSTTPHLDALQDVKRSAFKFGKGLLYLLAFDKYGYTRNSLYPTYERDWYAKDDEPKYVPYENTSEIKLWQPFVYNYSQLFIGLSFEIPFIELDSFLQKLEVYVSEKRELNPEAFVIHQYYTTAFRVMRAYSSVAKGGVKSSPHFVRRLKDKRGNVLYEPQAEQERLFSENAAQEMDSLMLINKNGIISYKLRKSGFRTIYSTDDFDYCARLIMYDDKYVYGVFIYKSTSEVMEEQKNKISIWMPQDFLFCSHNSLYAVSYMSDLLQ